MYEIRILDDASAELSRLDKTVAGRIAKRVINGLHEIMVIQRMILSNFAQCACAPVWV